MAKNIKIFSEKPEKKAGEKEALLQNMRKFRERGDVFKTGNIDALVVAYNKELKVYAENVADKTYRILVEKMHEGAVTIDKYGTILYCNSSFSNMVNLPLQKVIGTVFKKFIEDSSKGKFISLIRKGWKKATKKEVCICTSDKKVIPVLMSVNNFLVDNIFVLSIIITDLTLQNKNQRELRKANVELHEKAALLHQQEKKLIRANEDLINANERLEKRVFERTSELERLNHELVDLNLSKDRFLSVISHDLRNPLSALLISSDFLISQTTSDVFAGIQPLTDIIYRTSRKILNQLDELLAWAKMQEKKKALNLEKLQLVKEVDKSLELLKGISVQKKVILKNKVPLNIYVNADTLMLRSILQNLVTNAIKYTPQKGLITIAARCINKTAEISITDSGIGMDANMKEHLFKNRNYSSLEGTNNEKGTGLGLVLVKDFVTQLGGTLSVKSKLGKGTSIIFALPTFLQ